VVTSVTFTHIRQYKKRSDMSTESDWRKKDFI
jgi:hypothetical protein